MWFVSSACACVHVCVCVCACPKPYPEANPNPTLTLCVCAVCVCACLHAASSHMLPPPCGAATCSNARARVHDRACPGHPESC